MTYTKSTIVRVPPDLKETAEKIFPGATVIVHSDSFLFRLGRAWRELKGNTIQVEEDQGNYIKLTPAEIQSGVSRVKRAEGLIRQLPATHDGRNNWLLNYGSEE